MNTELLSLIRTTGYLSDGDLTDQARYDLLTPPFWRRARALGYDLPDLRRKLWRAAGRPESFLLSQLPQSEIEKAVRGKSKEEDLRKRIKETAAIIALLYKRGEKAIKAAIDQNLDNPDRLRSLTDRIRRELLVNAATWLGTSIPGLYLAGSRAGSLQGPHAKAAQAMTTQEFNRFKETDAQMGRHIEEVIAESEKRRAQAALANKKADYTGLKGRIIGHKTIDGKELSISSYIEMLALTAARNSFNEGSINRAVEQNEDLVLISREIRPNTCEVCREWAGKIVSISGRSREYPALDTALEQGLMHPNCIHHILPINYPGST
jgi:hypothetical protein